MGTKSLKVRGMLRLDFSYLGLPNYFKTDVSNQEKKGEMDLDIKPLKVRSKLKLKSSIPQYAKLAENGCF